MTDVYTRTINTMSTNARNRHLKAAKRYVEMGVSEKLANRMSALQLTRAALDIADLAITHKRDVLETAKLYSAFNEHLGLFWLHVGAEDLKVKGRWQAIARTNLREDFYRIRRDLAAHVLDRRTKKPLSDVVDQWLDDNESDVTRFREMVDEIRLRDEFDFATLSVAAQELRDLISN